jgi:hypothetical protein
MRLTGRRRLTLATKPRDKIYPVRATADKTFPRICIMQTVMEAQLEQKLDDLSLQFQRAGERNHEEHREIRAEIRSEIGGLRSDLDAKIDGLRAETNANFADLRKSTVSMYRTVIILLGSFLTAIFGSIAAAVAVHIF